MTVWKRYPLWCKRRKQEISKCKLTFHQRTLNFWNIVLECIHIPQFMWCTFISYRVKKYVYYHLRMRVGNVFSRVCPVCPSVCPSVPSVCLSLQTITFEPLHIGTSFLVWRYILTVFRSSLSIKVIGSSSRSCVKNWLFTYFNFLFPLYVATGH